MKYTPTETCNTHDRYAYCYICDFQYLHTTRAYTCSRGARCVNFTLSGKCIHALYNYVCTLYIYVLSILQHLQRIAASVSAAIIVMSAVMRDRGKNEKIRRGGIVAVSTTR